jgi:N-methylhydantoinase A
LSRYRAAVDIGGSFTDLVFIDEKSGKIGSAKVPSTPEDVAVGVIDAVERGGLDLSECRYFIHGTTVGLNAFIQRKGAKTGLITTEGFRDVLEIARMSRDVMYNLWYQRPPPFVERPLRLEVAERINAQGKVVLPLKRSDVRKAIQVFRSKKVEAVAVCLLHSYANPKHERAIREILRKDFPGVPYSLSSDITREYREYERTNTTVLDAYIKPLMSRYVRRLEHDLKERGFRGKLMITLSSGGARSAFLLTKTPIMALNSGPAGGVVGASNLSRRLQSKNLIGIDAGGTSFDVSLVVESEPSIAEQSIVESYPILTAAIDIRSIGAGGGSIAWIDEGGHLHVGPQSAGAEPGPMCYGKGGTRPTVTDAAICAGILDPKYFLGGSLELEPKLSFEGMKELGSKLDLSVEEASAGILSLITANMAGAVREITIGQGRDPREFSLLSYGGATSMLVAELASELGMTSVIVPREPGNFSAWGMLFMDVVYDYSRTFVGDFGEVNIKTYNDIFSELEETGARELAKEGIGKDELGFSRSIDLRYEWQSHYIRIPISYHRLDKEAVSKISDSFHDAHERNFGHRRPAKIQSVHLRTRAIGLLSRPNIMESEAESESAEDALESNRNVYLRGEGFVSYNIYKRSALNSGNVIAGPAIIEEETSTTLIRKGDKLTVDRFGNLTINIRPS